MFAVIKTGGKQYKVTKDDIIIVEKLEAETGNKVSFNQVLITSNDGAVKVGEPTVKGASVEAEVIEHGTWPLADRRWPLQNFYRINSSCSWKVVC